MKLKKLEDIKDIKGKTALVRVDFNVPLKKGKIADDTRIKAVLPTLNYLLSAGTKIVILTHLGRPDGKVMPELATKILADRLGKLLKKNVIYLPDLPAPDMLKRIVAQPGYSVVMLENIRFWPGEEKNDKKFAKQLAQLGDVYVNDAFSVSHRAHASVEGITHFIKAYAGLTFSNEVENLVKILESNAKPKVAIVGGAKLETKVKVIKNLLKKMDWILVGGAIANNFIKVLGHEVGQSKIDDKELKTAKSLLNKKLVVPVDVAVGSSLDKSSTYAIKQVSAVGKKDLILDLGPATVKQYITLIKQAKLVVWNGPLGYFENKKFKKASQEIAKAISQSKVYSVVGGGETGQLLEQLKLTKKFSFVSLSGGAMLEFLEGKILPGVKPLIKK
ncbi:MAG: phosphoglycerate kinase [Candidatus Komeilibacteria bacterium]|nr:phosphoglycerate kinase [Candidatus Komeilibacteria bacterium]